MNLIVTADFISLQIEKSETTHIFILNSWNGHSYADKFNEKNTKFTINRIPNK